MNLLVLVTGVGMLGAGLWGLAAPVSLMRWVERFTSPRSLYVAMGVRILLGAFFVYVAPLCRAEALIRVIGILMILAGTIGVGVGPNVMRQLVDWWVGRSSTWIRGWAVFALGMGGVLLWAGLPVAA